MKAGRSICVIIKFKVSFFTSVYFSCEFGQVERVFGANHPDPLEIEKAKKVLKVRRENPPKSLVLGVLPLLSFFPGFCCISRSLLNLLVTFIFRSKNKHLSMQFQGLMRFLMAKAVLFV